MTDIESGIPVEKYRAKKKYPFSKMEIGDSFFFVELPEVESAQNAGKGYANRHNPDFRMTRRKVEGGYRLWRIA